MPRILVTGSRTWTNRDVLENALIEAWREVVLTKGLPHPVVLVHGDAKGADRMAEALWHLAHLPVEAHPADWRPSGIYNPHAGHARNQKMVDLGADLCLAFIHNNSAGATDCARRAEEAGIPVRYFRE